MPEAYTIVTSLVISGSWNGYSISPAGTEKIGNLKDTPMIPFCSLTGGMIFFVRPASVVPLGVGYLFVYEGSNVKWHDPVYNVATGLGFTFDLRNVIDLTPRAPLVVSTTPGKFHTWRYSHWMEVDGELWVYAEVARENDSNEIRLFKLPKKLTGTPTNQDHPEKPLTGFIGRLPL